MKLNISNLNIVGSAEITVNGLAVIAGENGTGKSTVGKTLFATLKAISRSRGNTAADRANTIAELADPIFSRLFRLRLTDNGGALEKALPSSRAQFLDEICSMASANDVHRYFEPIFSAMTDTRIIDALKSETDTLAAYMDIPSDNNAALSVTLGQMLRSEFLGNISSVGDGIPCVTFSDEVSGLSLSYEIPHGTPKVTSYTGEASLRDITYIESPLYLHLLDILGKVAGARLFDDGGTARSLMLPAHVADIVEKIELLRYVSDIRHDNAPQLSSTLARLAGGEFYYDPARHVVMFRQGDNDIVPLNVASGVKSLGLLQILLDNKIVTPDRPLIWDEPENHLHPSWQIRLAQFLVILAAQGIPVVVSTHSPYFIQGIRHFAVKLHAEQFVDYYLTEMDGTSSVTQCVNDDLNRIFIKLAAPLNEIMDLSD